MIEKLLKITSINATLKIISTSLKLFLGINEFTKYFEEYSTSDVMESIIVITARNIPISEIDIGKGIGKVIVKTVN